MTRLNLIGTSFTIALLLIVNALFAWKIIRDERELLECYKAQLRDAVTLIPQDLPK